MPYFNYLWSKYNISIDIISQELKQDDMYMIYYWNYQQYPHVTLYAQVDFDNYNAQRSLNEELDNEKLLKLLVHIIFCKFICGKKWL